MLEAIIAITSLITGMGIGWLIHSRLELGNNPEKISSLEKELRSTRESEIVSRANFENLQQKFDEEKKRLEEIRKEMENSFKAMAADIANNNSETFLKQANQQFKSLKESSEKDLDEKKKMIDKSLVGMNEKLESLHKQSTELKSSIDKCNN